MGIGATLVLPGVAFADEFPAVPGMAGDRRANEFWYRFDQELLFDAKPEILDAYTSIGKAIGGSPDLLAQTWLKMVKSLDYPGNYAEFVSQFRPQFELLSRTQLGIMDRFYRPNSPELAQAFGYFGAGVLFDPRRADIESEVHRMDGDPPIGYHTWHAFLRGMMFLGISPERWACIDPLVAYGWAVQSVAKPKPREINPPLPPATMGRLAYKWLPRTVTQLDRDFQSVPFPAR